MTNTKRTVFVVVCSVALVMLLATNHVAAQSPFQFLRLAQNARSAALGGAFVSVIGDPGGVFINPASVATVEEDMALSVTFLKHVTDINSGVAAYTHRLEGIGTIAGSVAYTNFGSFERADRSGNVTGSFGANNLALAATFSNTLDSNLYYGVTLKYIFGNIAEQNSSAIAADVGLLMAIPNSRTNIGISVLNIGTQLSTFAGVRESMPLDIRLGVNHRLRGLPLLINFSFHHLADSTESFLDRLGFFSIGGEFYLGKALEVRLGYDNRIRQAAGELTSPGIAGFSGGIGFKTDIVRVDYGAVSIGSSALLHRLGVNLLL